MKEKTQYTSGMGEGIHMRPSRVLHKLRNGEVASCIKINTSDPRIVEIVAMSGFDAVWLCNEHVPGDMLNIENQARAAKLHDCDPILRCRRGSYSDHIIGYEMDCVAVIVPHVMNLADAKRVVEMTKFPPVGKRAVDGGNADGAYCMVDFNEYLETANKERFNILQIEDPDVLPDLEAIAELPGVDMLFFGPGDFSVATGKPGQVNDPEIQAIRERVAKVARAAGKHAGTPAGPANMKQLADMGYNFLTCGADIIGINLYAREMLKAYEQI